MLSHTDLKKGTIFLYNNQIYEVLDYSLNFKGRGSSVAQVKMRNLYNGNVLSQNFKAGDNLDEAIIERKKLTFLYSHKGQYFFCPQIEPSKRFFLTEQQIGSSVKFLKQNMPLEGIMFKEKIINIELPVKIALQVRQSPPGIKGDRAEGGTKQVVLETGAVVSVPLFIKEGDTIEINTQTETYVKRI